MPTFQPRIAIVGGGPSGLALGQLLHQRGIRATIYEQRGPSTPEELAKPSGMLDLHEESGLTVMRECGLWDGFQAAVGDCSESMRVMNAAGAILHVDEGSELESRPEIARNALTSLLIRNIPPDTIKWEHKILAVRSDRDPTTGAVEITFDLGAANGTAAYDFVVGADGAWSRIRSLLLRSDVRPVYSGAQYVTATARHVSTKYADLAALSGPGTLCALGGGNGILTQRGPQDSIRLYAAVSTPHEHWAAAMGLEGQTAAEVKATLLDDDRLFRGWAAPLQDLLATACDEETTDNPGRAADIKPYYMLPLGYRWPHRTGVTLIGDAAHLMTPWGGEGVNLALWDALDLARVLAATVSEVEDEAENNASEDQAKTDAGEKKAKSVAAATWQALLDPHIRAFESAMLARADDKAAETDRNRQLFLSENGAQALADFFKGVGDGGAAAAATTTASTITTATTNTIFDGDGDDDEGRMLYGGNSSSSSNNSRKIGMDS